MWCRCLLSVNIKWNKVSDYCLGLLVYKIKSEAFCFLQGKEMTSNSHRYIPLNSLKTHTKVDVYGVVKFFKPPYKSRGSDYCTMVSIVDPSYKDPLNKLKCLLFAKELNKLPPVKLGHIVRFHRLSISEYMGSLQGQNSPGFSWLLFSGDVGAPLEPLKSSSPSYSITDNDREKVKELRNWSCNKDELQEKLCAFKDVALGGYFDLVCQVVYTSVIEADVGRLMKVWDGTQCLYNIRNISTDSQEQNVQKDDSLMRKARGCIYDVCVFDNHFRSSKNIKPGDYVKFINLHAAEHKSLNNKENAHPVVEFVLHRGDAFGRSVGVLSPDDPDLETMKGRQEIVAMENDSFNLSEALQQSTDSPDDEKIIKDWEPVPSTSREPEKTLSGRKNVIYNQEEDNCFSEKNTDFVNEQESRKSLNSDTVNDTKKETESKRKCPREVSFDKYKTNEQSSSESKARCMIQTNTVVINHPHTKRSRICKVLKHDVPYKFRVQARVFDYFPKPDSVKHFLMLYCSQCHYLCSHPGAEGEKKRCESPLQIGSTFKGVAHYNCPRCLQNQDSFHDLDSPPHLQYIYMLRFILSDDSGMLMANIWREEAVQFFQDMEPEELLKDESNLNHIKSCLNYICPSDHAVEDRPWIECCLKSYSVAEGTGYQIFDTCIA